MGPVKSKAWWAATLAFAWIG